MMTFPSQAFRGEEENITIIRDDATETWVKGVATKGSKTQVGARAVVRPIDTNQMRNFNPEASFNEQHYNVLSQTVIRPGDQIEFSERSNIVGRVVHCDDNQRHGSFTRAYVTITQTFGG